MTKAKSMISEVGIVLILFGMYASLKAMFIDNSPYTNTKIIALAIIISLAGFLILYTIKMGEEKDERKRRKRQSKFK